MRFGRGQLMGAQIVIGRGLHSSIVLGLVQSHFGSPQLKRIESGIAPLVPRGFDPACWGLSPSRLHTLSQPTTPAKTYMSGGVENPHMQGIVCLPPCSDYSDGASRAPSTIAYSDSD